MDELPARLTPDRQFLGAMVDRLAELTVVMRDQQDTLNAIRDAITGQTVKVSGGRQKTADGAVELREPVAPSAGADLSEPDAGTDKPVKAARKPATKRTPAGGRRTGRAAE